MQSNIFLRHCGLQDFTSLLYIVYVHVSTLPELTLSGTTYKHTSVTTGITFWMYEENFVSHFSIKLRLRNTAIPHSPLHHSRSNITNHQHARIIPTMDKPRMISLILILFPSEYSNNPPSETPIKQLLIPITLVECLQVQKFLTTHSMLDHLQAGTLFDWHPQHFCLDDKLSNNSILLLVRWFYLGLHLNYAKLKINVSVAVLFLLLNLCSVSCNFTPLNTLVGNIFCHTRSWCSFPPANTLGGKINFLIWTLDPDFLLRMTLQKRQEIQKKSRQNPAESIFFPLNSSPLISLKPPKKTVLKLSETSSFFPLFANFHSTHQSNNPKIRPETLPRTRPKKRHPYHGKKMAREGSVVSASSGST
ncbi:hypothetical protein VP01_603g3 [Puccinia sorghi]|uniref:Uncharacterized protein n=1 Tax=Puccinia sorghi TaxID=27349 RepID=A0A0L6UI44_9BASI|nr:hypothetical protein VP01_603g3 [Puccinia sorghi]